MDPLAETGILLKHMEPGQNPVAKNKTAGTNDKPKHKETGLNKTQAERIKTLRLIEYH